LPGFSPQGIFLSYRRDDGGPYASSLQLQLSLHIPDAPIFMDLDSIEPGLDFAEVIQGALDSCAVLVVLIGRQWATLTDEDGNRRLDNPDDYVRFEVKTALEREVRVIPVLFDGARPLRQQELPAELHKLARLNAHKLSYDRYKDDTAKLLDLIQRVLATAGEQAEAEPQAQDGVSDSRGRSTREDDLQPDLAKQPQDTEKPAAGRVPAADDVSGQTAGSPDALDSYGIPAAPGDFGVGSHVAGYRLDEQIGRGRMAVVYRAYDTRLERRAALKILAPEVARDEGFRLRFIRESRVAAAVDHPNIIPIYEAGEADGVLFIAMRLVEGRDVRTLVNERDLLPTGLVCDIVTQVASALDAAHAHGLIHGNVEPGNMLREAPSGRVDPDHIYLSGFGLSKHLLSGGTTLTSEDEFLGTLSYIAPEQIEGRPVDGRTDEYALACSAFEMLAGEPPFRGDESIAIMWAQLSSAPPSLTSIRPDLPTAVDEVMATALAKAPGDRYASCPEFAAALRRACGLRTGETSAHGKPARAAHVDITQPRLLGGRYELDGIVGRGGMAEVFRARDIRLDRIVAVKTLREDLARDATFQARFRREAQSAASLNHPSIVAVYDTGEDNAGPSHVPYIVMEYVDGRTLRDLLRDDRRLLPERALEITDGVLRALDYSHRHGIVHRDIKPGNVMLTRTGEVKVMDFGIIMAVSNNDADTTDPHIVIGTAQYLSPEQARGERVDAPSDLYSTGCLLYELLTGRPPFLGDSPVAIAYQHVRENPVPPSRLDPEIPAWADSIVLRAMAKDPGRRYQSATEMRTDIQRALSSAPEGPGTHGVTPESASPAGTPPEETPDQRSDFFYRLRKAFGQDDENDGRNNQSG
jgi:serine/threonine protein kinase